MGKHIILDGSSQYLDFTTPAGSLQVREISSRMISARIGHGTDQVLFDWAGVGILYIKAISGGVTNLQFVPASGTGTATVNISAFTSGFMYRFCYDDVGPNMAYILQAWDRRGDSKTTVWNIVTASASSINPNSRAVRIGAKADGTLKLQANVDFWRWHNDELSPHYPQTGEIGGQVPAPTATKSWMPCNTINGGEDWIDFRFEDNLTNSGNVSVTLTATGSPTYGTNPATPPTAIGEDLTGVAKGRIPLSATLSYDYESDPAAATALSDTLSSNWTYVSGPVAGGALTIRNPSKLFTWVDGATVAGTYTFSFAVTNGTNTDSDTVTIEVVNLSASISDTNGYVDEPCVIDASASTGWDSIKVDTGETIPNSSLHYDMLIPRSVHRYHAAGVYTATVTAYDAQGNSVTDTATITITARAEADASNTEDLTNPANANYIAPANYTSNPTGNLTKVQAAVDICKARNTVPQKIIVPAGFRADGQLILKTPVGNEMITIISSGTLPSSHKRISAGDISQMGTFRATLGNTPSITTDPAGSSHHYKLRGLILDTTVQQNELLRLGEVSVEKTTSTISHHFIAQHCIIRPSNEFSGSISNSIVFNANDVSIIDSIIGPNSFGGVESHNLLCYSSEGRHVINNNYVGGASANLFYGGAVTKVHGMVPKDIEIRENYFTRPLEWKPSHPSWDGKTRGVKNLWELKTGSNMVTQGNKLENNWTDAQSGTGVVIQASCDAGNWAQAFDIDWSYNQVLNSEIGINFRSGEYRGILQSKRVWFTHNLLEGLTTRAYYFLASSKVRLNHNTALSVSSGTAAMDTNMRQPGFIYENSIAYEGSFGWFGSGVGGGTNGLNVYFPGFIFRDSLQVGGSSGSYGSPVTGMQFPANETAVGFTNPAGGVWSLGSGSAYKNDANDGTDPGVNWTDLQAHLAHTVDGDWTTGGGGGIVACKWNSVPVCQ